MVDMIKLEELAEKSVLWGVPFSILYLVLTVIAVKLVGPETVIAALLWDLWRITTTVLVFGGFLSWMILGSIVSLKLSIPGKKIIDVKLVVNNLVENSTLYQTGLRNGDVVTQIDGQLLEDDDFLSCWWQNKDSIVLTVLRNGQEVLVTLQKE